MARVLVAALVALIISILAGPVFIDFLRRHALGQHRGKHVAEAHAQSTRPSATAANAT